MSVFLESCQRVATLGRQIASGGQGSIHDHPFDPKKVVKKYSCPTPEQAAKLKVMVDDPFQEPPSNGGSVRFFKPTHLITNPDDPAEVLGYEMDLAEDFTSLVHLCNPSTRDEDADLPFRLRVARNICWGVAALHNQGVVIGDLRPSNILVGPKGEAWFIDCDSYQIQSGSATHHCLLGRPELTAPELHDAARDQVTLKPSHDRFALAITLFMLLTDGSHPYAAHFTGPDGGRAKLHTRVKEGWWPYVAQHTHPYEPRRKSYPFYIRLNRPLRRLLEQCFVAGHSDPDKRPSASDWHVAIDVVLSAKRFRRLVIPQPTKSRYSLRRHRASLRVLHPTTWFLRQARVPLQYTAALLLGLLVGVIVNRLYDWSRHDSRSSSNITQEETSAGEPTPRLWKDLAEGRR